MFLSVLICFVVIFFHCYYVVLSATVCPVDKIQSKIISNLVLNFACNKSSSCNLTSFANFGAKLQKTVIIVQNEKSSKTTNLIENMSHCSKSEVLLFDTSKSLSINLSSICIQKTVQTLVIDTTDLGLERSSKEHRNIKECLNYNFEEKDHGLKTIFNECQQVLLINNITCDADFHYLPSLFNINDGLKNSLTNKTIRVTPSIPSPPFVIYNEPLTSNITNNDFTGTLFEVINKIANKLEFNYTIIMPIDRNFGAVDANGSWNGLIGMLERNETDLVLAGLTVTYNRSTVVDFSTPYYNEPMVVIFQYKKTDQSLLGLVKLFTPPVWAVYFASLFTAIFVIWFLHRFTVVDGDAGIDSITSSAWYVYSAQMNQQADRIIESWSGRIFEVVWRFMAFVVIATYTGGFVADLTSSRINLPVKSLKDVIAAAHNGLFKICVSRNSAFSSAVQADFSGPYKDLNQWLMKNPDYYMDTQKCNERLMAETNFAVIAELTKAEELQKKACLNSTSLIILNDPFFAGYFALAFQRNSPYTEIISTQIADILERGLADIWYKNYTTKIPFCNILKPDQILDANSQGLNMRQIGGAFVLLAIGIVISCLIFFYEIPRFHSWFENKKSCEPNCKVYNENAVTVIHVVEHNQFR